MPESHPTESHHGGENGAGTVGGMAGGRTAPIVPDGDVLAEVRRIFAERHAAATAPSIVYGVLAGGRLVAGEGFGSIDAAGTAPTVDTAYRIASMTKSFTAAALLILRDGMAVRLDDPIAEFVPKVRFVRPPGTARAAEPTLRMLLTMSAGLPSDDPWADRQESRTDDEFDALLAQGVRLVHVPGTTFEYSNLGYALLGRVIEECSEQGYHDMVTNELLAPLGLAATGWDEHVAAPGGIATGYERVGDDWVSVPFSAPGAFSPIGGLFSTVRDMATWMQWFVDADISAPPKREPLSAQSRHEMQQGQRLRPVEPLPGDLTPSAAYGFGLVEQHDAGHTVVYHSGGYPGFSSHMRWHPASGIGIVALENATYAGAAAPGAQAMRVILENAGAQRVDSGDQAGALSYDLAIEQGPPASSIVDVLRGAAQTMAMSIRRLVPPE